MELERTWMLARLMDGCNTFTIPVHPYLHVWFIGSGTDLFIRVPELLSKRTPADDVLKTVKEENGEIAVEWQSRK